jgi:hypothetical protein
MRQRFVRVAGLVSITVALVVSPLAANAQPPPDCASGANCPFNQSGGTSVGTLNLYQRPPPRMLDDAAKAMLLSLVPKDKPVSVTSINENESIQYAQRTYDFLKENGYKVEDTGIRIGMFTGPVYRAVVQQSKDGLATEIIIGENQAPPP